MLDTNIINTVLWISLD